MSVTMLYGAAGNQQARANPDSVVQYETEVVTATQRRAFKGPQRMGGLSLDLRVDAVAAPTSVTGFTLWYSNLPKPDTSSDTDWHQDTTLGTILVLTAAGKTFVDLADRRAEWFMLKADVTAGSATVRAFVRREGVEV